MARKSDDRQAPEGAYAGEGRTVTREAAAGAQPRRDGGRVLRILALIAVAAGLTGLTAAACVLSYSSIHHLAMEAGVHGRLASVYPYIFDAMLVVAGCSVLALRGAGLVSRIYSWLCMLVLLAALAGGGAIRAAAVAVPHKLAGVIAAIVPWVLVLIGFGLLLALLRYARLRRLGKRNGHHGDEAGSAMRDPAVARPAADDAPVTSPAVTSPTVTSPTVTSPTVTNPTVTNPTVTNPTVTNPTAASPEAASPEAAGPGVRRPGAPTVIGAPVTERDRERGPVPPRTLIPGQPQPPQAAGAPDPARARPAVTRDPAAGAGADAMAGLAGAAAVPLAKDEQQAAGDTRATAAKRAADADETADATGTRAAVRPAAALGTAATAAGQAAGAGAGPPTVPGATVPAQPASRQETTQAAAGRVTDQAPQPAAPAPDTKVQARPPVRRAEMQLRARIPKQPGQDAGPSPAAPGWPAPFMPRVGQQGGQVQEAGAQHPPEAGSPPSSAGQPGAQEPAAGMAPDALPKRIPGQQRGIAGGEAAPAQQGPGSGAGPQDTTITQPKAQPDAGSTAAAGPSGEQPAPHGDAQSAGSTLSPAPTHPADEDQALGLPALRRTRSSPVPPQGNDPHVADPEDNDSQNDAGRL